MDFLVVNSEKPELIVYVICGFVVEMKKKKVYTTKKKSKHHHKSEKLHALKFYNVDKNGKIQRTRKECPKCGPGYFFSLFQLQFH